MKKIKNLFFIILCVPIVFFTGCDKFRPKCKEVYSVGYYFQDKIKCSFFNSDVESSISLDDISKSKLDKSFIEPYAQLTLTANSAEAYHLYIEYIYFVLYTNEDSEFELNVNISMTNVIDESNVGNKDNKDTTYTNTYSCIAKKNNKATFKIYVNRTVATALGSTLTIDVLDSDIYYTDPNTKFAWCIYDFKIYGESRAYCK